MTNLAREIVLAAPLSAPPRANDFVAIERPLAPLGAGELRLAPRFLSLDPYLGPRLQGRHMGEPAPQPGAPLPGWSVGEVVESRDAAFRAGDLAVAECGWATLGVAAAGLARKVEPVAPLSAHLGALGMPGLTAWAGVTRLAQVGEGDVFTVDAAAGPVGGTAGQIARNLGARAIGIAGGEAKARVVREVYGLDAAVDHRDADWPERLREATGGGPTAHFENVGPTVLDRVLPLLRIRARVVLCGLAGAPQTPPSLPYGLLIGKRAQVFGLVVYDHFDALGAWVEQARAWMEQGRLALHEDVAEGLDSAPGQLERLLAGHTVGKALVRVAGGA